MTDVAADRRWFLVHPLVAALLVAASLPTPVVAAADPCAAAAASAFASCLKQTTRALRACAALPGGACATAASAPTAATRLRRKLLARCTPATVRNAGFAPPFEPAELATRLAGACRGNAIALVGRGADALGTTVPPACLAGLAAAARRLVVGTFVARSACTLAGTRCNPGKVATKVAAAEERARRAVARRCGPPTPALEGVLARTSAQVACALAEAVPASGTCAPSGADALVDLWRLATPRPAGTRVAQVSSYDRTGANFDQGVGPDTVPYLVALGIPPLSLDNSYLYVEGGRFVVFDEVGPGVVWRIWMTGLEAAFGDGNLGGDIAIEVDGEAVPRVQLTRTALFAGTTPPFLAPLAGNFTTSSGGFYSIVPMPFARRLRISTSLVPNWLQVTYSKTPPDQALPGFDPTADTSVVAARLAAAGDPATTVTPTDVTEVTPSIAHGATQTIWSRNGTETVVRLELLAPAGADIPTGLRFRATFDGAPLPQVDAPLDDLFGASLGGGARSIAFGRDGDRYYCYFPMPFSTSARFDVENQSGAPFDGWTFRVGAVGATPPGPPAHFHAAAASASLAPDGHDYVLLDAAGAGHVVGIVMTAGCAGVGLCELPILVGLNGTHLEGDERTTVDGSRWPQLHGTGLEDIFNGGFYFATGAVRLPTHGNPVQVPGTSPRRPGVNLRSAYRLFLGEAIPFESQIRVAVEHGPVNDVPAELSSLVFYYARQGPALAQTDHVAIGDPVSEAAHGLATTGRTDVLLTSAFRGDDSDVPVTAAGMTASTTHVDVTVDATNRGVRLRRLADIGAGAQAARVFVDGAFAGVWRSTEVNPTLRWAELEFELPAALTAGRTRLGVDLDASASPTPWTAFEYTVLSHLP